MKSEELITLSAAHCVDLLDAARMMPEAKPQRDVIKQRFADGRSAQVLQEPARNRARGTGDRPMVRPTWTIAEIGQAATGVPAVPFMAACWRQSPSDTKP